MYTIWTQFDTSDVSAGGYDNGEIYMSYTSDGSLWEEPVNLTDSPTPGCLPREYTQVNEKIIDNSKRLLYFLDVERDKLYFRKFYLGNLGLNNETQKPNYSLRTLPVGGAGIMPACPRRLPLRRP